MLQSKQWLVPLYLLQRGSEGSRQAAPLLQSKEKIKVEKGQIIFQKYHREDLVATELCNHSPPL